MASDAQIIAEWRALAPTLKARVTELLDRVEKSEAELAHLRDALRAANRGDCVSKSMLGNACKCCKAREVKP